MKHVEATLQSGGKLYGLQTYFPYTDKIFFSNIDKILLDEDYFDYIINQLVRAYKEDIVFDFLDIKKHKYIVPIMYSESCKITNINKKIAKALAKKLDVNYIEDYFEECDLSSPDIRDAYISKADFNFKINKLYVEDKIIFFDACSSTGNVFDAIFNVLFRRRKKILKITELREKGYEIDEYSLQKEKLDDIQIEKNIEEIYDKKCLLEPTGMDKIDACFLSFGIRFNAPDITNTKILEIYPNKHFKNDIDKKGYIVRIYGLFGKKDVSINMKQKFLLDIGENGFGKSTAMKIAALALQNNRKSRLLLSKYFFEKVEVYGYDHYDPRFINFLEDCQFDIECKQFALNDEVYHPVYKRGTIIGKKLNKEGVRFAEIFFIESGNIERMKEGYFRVLNKEDNCLSEGQSTMVEFVDKLGKVFFVQMVKPGENIDFSVLDSLGYNVLNENKMIWSEEIKEKSPSYYTIKFNELDFKEYISKINKEYFLLHTISYASLLPQKDTIDCNSVVKKFLNTISDLEYCQLCRKIINDDRTIDMDFSAIIFKYKFKFDFNLIHPFLKNVLSKYYEAKETEGMLNNKRVTYFNCAFNRNLDSKKINEMAGINAISSNTSLYYLDETEEVLELDKISRKYGDEEYEEEEFIDEWGYEEDYDGYEECDIEEDYDEYEEEEFIVASGKKYNNYDEWGYEEDYDEYEECDYEEDYDEYEEYDYEEDFDSYDDTHNPLNVSFKKYRKHTKDCEKTKRNKQEDKIYVSLHLRGKRIDMDESILKDERERAFVFSGINNRDELIDMINDGSINVFDSIRIKKEKIVRYSDSQVINLFSNEKLPISEILRTLFSDTLIKTHIRAIFSRMKNLMNTNKFVTNDGVIMEFLELDQHVDITRYQSLYNKIFVQNIDEIKYGVSSLIEQNQEEEFLKIFNEVRFVGACNAKYIIAMLLLNSMLEDYRQNAVSRKSILLEKLINKYFNDKQVYIHLNNLVVKDDNGNIVPLDKLSTGEKNLITVFILTMLKKDGILILDEPELSMSVDWQRNILLDLIRISSCDLIVVSQSPLLIQANGLSNCVCRMDDKMEEIAAVSVEAVYKFNKYYHVSDT